jgi:tetratricopeptide (TPR) repeat protein
MIPDQESSAFRSFQTDTMIAEVNTMKCKSVFLVLFIGLLALAVLLSLSAPLMAQKATDRQDTTQTDQAAADKPAEDQTGTAMKKDAPVKNADYWFDRGALCATYGNDKAAIKYFQKVIELDPKRSGAYFEQGISYGQLEKFDKALPLIDKAIAMEPENGLFIYGRGRVHLLAGDREKAMADFKKAAELDDEDAQAYMEAMPQAE